MNSSQLVAPGWAQVLARICFALVAIATVRVIIDFRWDFVAVAAVALLIGTILPSLLVAFGFGQPAPQDEWR
jgi:preprotein translocase subunit SecF